MTTPAPPAAALLVTLPLPPETGIDPSTWCEKKLERYGFPARPDPSRDPAAHAFWTAAFCPATRYVPISVEAAGFRSHADVAASPDAIIGNWATSRNWSGFGVGAVQARTIAGVAGAWTIPRQCDRPVDPPLDGIWRYSCWVGVDGVLPYASGLPQVGTDVTLDTEGAVVCRGWVQWYAPIESRVILPLTLLGFEVARGDRIAGFVTVRRPDAVDLALVNLRVPAAPVAALVRLSSAALPEAAALAIRGTTAEWVVERTTRLPDPLPRPADAPREPYYPMPDFGVVPFDGLSVQQWDDPAAPASRRFQSDRALTQISMYDLTANPAGLRTLTRPRLAGEGGQVRYWNARANETPWPR